jgi:tryptophan-rich sensory protein
MYNRQIYHILTPIGLGLVMNFMIFYFNIGRMANRKPTKNPWIPPGYVIGTVWMILLGCMGMAHYLLSSSSRSSTASDEQKRSYGIYAVDFLILFSILYPLLTGLKNNDYFFLSLSLLITLSVSLVVKMYSLKAFYYLLPVVGWVVYVNLATYLGG